jgi:hypothetical protein
MVERNIQNHDQYTEVQTLVNEGIRNFNALPWYRKSIPHRIIARNLRNILKDQTNANTKDTAYKIKFYLEEKKINNKRWLWFDQNLLFNLKNEVSEKFVEFDNMEQSRSQQLANYRETINEKSRDIAKLELDIKTLQLSLQDAKKIKPLESGNLQQKIELELQNQKKQADLEEKIKLISNENERLNDNLAKKDEEIKSIKNENEILKDRLAKSEEKIEQIEHLSKIQSWLKGHLLWLIDLFSPPNLSEDLNTKIIKCTRDEKTVKNTQNFPPEFSDKLNKIRLLISKEGVMTDINAIPSTQAGGSIEIIRKEKKKTQSTLKNVGKGGNPKNTPTFFSGDVDDRQKDDVNNAVAVIGNQSTTIQ